ncbi:membrane dipeptidase [Cohnella endophytica]|uniref:Membrane dipeptidase n=1 Tax=Cohnella endophytica TaxID=2419778 RepID=A0A494XY89_9BACL|nr:dipeptidase [Cohnella endophytica]RKP55534.1 membrane dipeptidase [Cohnella endophytica]
MRVADLHVDVLSKLLEKPERKWTATEADEAFDATPARLEKGGVALQVFALYLPDAIPSNPESLFLGAELFWSKVLATNGMKLIRRSGDIENARQENKIGALLSLEGADGLKGQLWALRLLYRLGLRLLGPTWNHANWACDGALEPRGAGLTKAGKQLVTECENLGILVDVSHLSDKGFWDVAERASRPFFASHSNARSIVDNPRNLTDEQIDAIVSAHGIIGLTFVPWFVTATEPASIDDLLRHVEHVCSLGGADHIAFGSDFDGISRHVQGLTHPGQYPDLADALLKRYSETQVIGFMGANAIRYFTKNLKG